MAKRGIYCVAFGEPARLCVQRLLTSVKKHMPDVPVCLCAAQPVGLEDVHVHAEDGDIGARGAKLRIDDLAPSDWQHILYLDADTELVAPIYRYFDWLADGWEFVICKDPDKRETLHAYLRENNVDEYEELQKLLGTMHLLQMNGGAWAYARNERTTRFMKRWHDEWQRYGKRDQGALVRALYAEPLRMLLLTNHWNTFPQYNPGMETAGLLHYPMDARRWEGAIPGRLDAPEAWGASERFMARWKPHGRQRHARGAVG